MKQTSLVLLGLSVSSGIGAGLLLAANLIVWAVLTLWIGSILAFFGFALIVWALRPKRDEQADADPMPVRDESETTPA